MSFLITFFISSAIVSIWYAIEEKESSISDVCRFIICIFIGFPIVFSLIRIFLYDFYCEFFELFETLDYRLIKTNKIFEVCCTLSKIYLISLIAAFVISLIYMRIVRFNEASTIFDTVITLIVTTVVSFFVGYVLIHCNSIESILACNSIASFYILYDTLFAKVGIGIAFLGKALLILGIIAIAIKVIIWIIKDKRTTYYATKNHALELLSRLYLAVDEANDVIIKFYTNNPFASRYMIDVSEIKDNCKRIRKKMKAWSKEMLEDEEKHEAASTYYSSFLSFDRDIRETLGYLEEIFEEFSPTSAVGYLEYNDKLERCSDTYNDIYRKVEECNKYMEHYNDVMGHFPYDCIEFSKLEEIQF